MTTVWQQIQGSTISMEGGNKKKKNSLLRWGARGIYQRIFPQSLSPEFSFKVQNVKVRNFLKNSPKTKRVKEVSFTHLADRTDQFFAREILSGVIPKQVTCKATAQSRTSDDKTLRKAFDHFRTIECCPKQASGTKSNRSQPTRTQKHGGQLVIARI